MQRSLTSTAERTANERRTKHLIQFHISVDGVSGTPTYSRNLIDRLLKLEYQHNKAIRQYV